MIRNTNDGSGSEPRMRCYMNLMALEDLPPFSAGPKKKDPAYRLKATRKAGYEGVQFIQPVSQEEIAVCEKLGLGRCSLGRVNEPGEAEELASRFSDEGQECGTLHLGWGLEDDDEAARLIEAVLTASEKYDIPLYVETHRATIFQDNWRTLQFVERFPELRFNGDFSHWYTGLEMVYGGFERKLDFMAPVVERVRFLHGRIGSPGCMQVPVSIEKQDDQPYVDHFRTMWTRAFRAFLDTATAGDYILFVPELLSPRIFYERVFPVVGEMREESDRWLQALVLRSIAQECFALAKEKEFD